MSKEATKRWREKNPDRVRATIKRWREKNPDRVRATIKRWREENSDRNTELHNKYYKKGARHQGNHRQSWTQEDVAKIIATDRPPDQELAKELGRTVKAIETKRYKTVETP